MGKNNSKFGLPSAEDGQPPPEEVCFDDFEVLRAIGRGAFGKVCLVERKRDRRVLAMKYVNKQKAVEKEAVCGVCSEVELLRALDHPFVAGLWYTFQVGIVHVLQLPRESVKSELDSRVDVTADEKIKRKSSTLLYLWRRN